MGKVTSICLLAASFIASSQALAIDSQELEARHHGSSSDPLAACSGYKAYNVHQTWSGWTADLKLAGPACNTYGTDLEHLKLLVEFQTESRLHVMIQDANNTVYQVPSSVFPRPSGSVRSDQSDFKFSYKESPFSFAVKRKSSGETLFDSSAASLVFESQYLRLRTSLPSNPSLYGLGEHTDPFQLNTTNYIRTLWSQDAYGVPTGTNLYGNHPIYFDHRAGGTHGVFMLNSNGMDIKINNTAQSGQYLEYNTLGGVVDLYFVSGPSPIEVAQQYAEITGLPAMMPYWGFGFHQCRYGYQDAYNVAEVIYNYSQANIPLETMWTDIDYMDRRRVFSLDPDRFPLDMVQDIVDHLHADDQHYIVMVDPAVADADYPPLNRGDEAGVFLKRSDGTDWQGVVWPGVTVFPDWFNDGITAYWNNEFAIFFDPESGVDIDALWIDMNEPSNFGCQFPCDNATAQAAADGFPPAPPPVREPPRPLPGWPCEFQPPGTCSENRVRRALRSDVPTLGRSLESAQIKRTSGYGDQKGLPGRDLLYPKYSIHNAAAYNYDNAAGGGLSNHTVNTDLIHQNGLAMYDTHNLFGTMMSVASRDAMLSRRPSVRPMIITRSTFSGAGAHVGHWLGDNLSDWTHYRISIASMLGFSAIYQVPMVGSDVCGFGDNTTMELCSRWAMLGAFSPFYRNHNNYPPSISQEFYQWPTVADAARKIIDLRYRLLDYLYTAFHKQTVDGTPAVSPMFFAWPQDSNVNAIDLQFMFGPSILVSPVTDEGATSVDAYFPQDTFYDMWTYKQLPKTGWVTLEDQGLTDIPVHIRGNSIIPLRVASANTTTLLRQNNYEILVATSQHGGVATGELYVDDGDSIDQAATTDVQFTFDGHAFSMKGSYGYDAGVSIEKVTFLGVKKPHTVKLGHSAAQWTYNATISAVVVSLDAPLTADLTITLS